MEYWIQLFDDTGVIRLGAFWSSVGEEALVVDNLVADLDAALPMLAKGEFIAVISATADCRPPLDDGLTVRIIKSDEGIVIV